jgi:hypothetical protein
LRRIGAIHLIRNAPPRVVGGPVDRAGRLRIGAGEIEGDAIAALDQGEGEFVQPGIADAVVLDIVDPGIGAVGDLRNELVAIDVAALVEDGLEAGLHGVAPEPGKQSLHPARPHQASLHLAVEVGSEHLGHPGIALDDGEHRLVADAGVVEPDRGDREAFLKHGPRGARHRTGHAAADIVVVPERLDIGDNLAGVEHRHGAAEVGQVADAALAEVGVVHREHVARPHGGRREIAHDGVGHRRVGAAGELAAVTVEQPDAIVVRLADHRRSRGALDGIFDLCLDRVERALDDLQDDRVDRARCTRRRVRCQRWALRSHCGTFR